MAMKYEFISWKKENIPDPPNPRQRVHTGAAGPHGVDEWGLV